MRTDVQKHRRYIWNGKFCRKTVLNAVKVVALKHVRKHAQKKHDREFEKE